MADKKRTWSEDTLEWGRISAKTNAWVREDPLKPEWAHDPKGLAARFVRIWRQSRSISDVRKTLFWVPVEELEGHRRSINSVLALHGYVPLPPLPLRRGEQLPEVPEILSADELAALAGEGVIYRFGEEPPAAAAAEAEAEADEAADAAADEEEELDLTPTPPRPDEDPYRGVSPLSLAIPGYGRNDPLSEYYGSIGADKMRIRIKH